MADPGALRRRCGQLVIGGFEGEALPRSFAQALSRGERGGAILFARNLTQEPMQCAELTRAIASDAPEDEPPLVAIDQEGGRVARLKQVLALPPMRALAARGSVDLVRRAAEALARELAALGITMNFAPVLDVNTRADNPVIGDRAFGTTAAEVARFGRAWIEGSLAGGVLACGKHFPGHGDTTKDSHFDLPVCDAVSASPGDPHLGAFEAVIRATALPSIMTAHVVYPRLDAERPATLSRAVLAIARERLGFTGCIVSDDLEMKAVADRWTVEESAVLAVEAGCDALLVCKSEELQERAVEALTRRASDDATFAARVDEAYGRFRAMREKARPRPVTTRAELDAARGSAIAVARELEVRA